MPEQASIAFRFKPNTSVGRQTTMFTEIFIRFRGGTRTGTNEKLDHSFYVPDGESGDAIVAELKAMPEIDPESVRLTFDDAER